MRPVRLPLSAALLAFMASSAAMLASCVFDLAPLDETSADGGMDAPVDHAHHDAHPDRGGDGHDDASDGDAGDDAPDDHVDANPCGNGVLDPGEACDDESAYCIDCQVPCDGAYQFRNNTTHHCYEAFKTGMTYADAKAYCESVGATLAIVRDTNEVPFIEGGILGIPNVSWNQRVWIGAHKGGGVWTWVDGHSLSTGDSDWAPNQPDGKYMGVSGASCLSLDRVNDGYDDAACDSIHDFVCEYAPPPPLPADAGDGG
jgi:Lectin C-type domain